MTIDDKVKLWDAINRYVITCGGRPDNHVYGNVARMNAVVELERVVNDIGKTGERGDQR